MRYRYEAIRKSGEPTAGVIEARDPSEATEGLYANGVYVTQIEPDIARERRLPGLKLGESRLKGLANITRQLAVLTGTGTQVVAALAAVERQLEPGGWKRTMGDVLKQVEEGATLASAMERHPKYFDAVYRSLICAGESGGNMPQMFARLAEITRRQLKIQNTVTGALAYPIFLLLISFVVVTVMLMVVLPRFSGMFESLDAPIPPTTQALLAASGILRGYWWVFFPALLGGAYAAVTAIRSPAGRIKMDYLMTTLPVIGPATRGMVTARIARTLGVLLEGRVPMLDAMALAKQSAGNARYAKLLEAAEDAVSRGEPMSAVMRESSLVAPAVYEALVTGERSGQVGAVLLNLSEFLDEDNEVVVKSLMSLIEPLILVVLGLVVGFVALSMFLPLFDLTGSAGGMS